MSHTWATRLTELSPETIGDVQARALNDAGFYTLADIAAALDGGADLTEIKWIGETTVAALRELLNAVSEEEELADALGPAEPSADEPAEEVDPEVERLAEVLVTDYAEEVERIPGSVVAVATEILRSQKADVPDGGGGAVIHARPIGPLRWHRDRILRILGLDRAWDRFLPRREPPLGHNTYKYLVGIAQGAEDEEALAQECGFKNRDHARHQVEEDVFALFENFALVKSRPIAMHGVRS